MVSTLLDRMLTQCSAWKSCGKKQAAKNSIYVSC